MIHWWRTLSRVPSGILIGIVRVYRYAISPFFPPSCRYYPSCSEYAVGALRHHGAIRGGILTVWRILRCNPWSSGGEDPVPRRHEHTTCDHSPSNLNTGDSSPRLS